MQCLRNLWAVDLEFLLIKTFFKAFQTFLFILIAITSSGILTLFMERIYQNGLVLVMFHTDLSMEGEDICMRSGKV